MPLEFLQDSYFVEGILCLCVTGPVRQEIPINFVLCTFVPILLLFFFLGSTPDHRLKHATLEVSVISCFKPYDTY